MAFKLLPFGLAKRVNPISVPHVIDCSYLATVEASPTLDLPRLGGFFGSFTHIGPANALNLKQSYLLKRPEALNFPGLPIVDPQTQVIRINQLEIPARESIELIPEADVLADNLLLNSAATASDALDDGLAFFEIKILSEGFLLAHVKIVSCPLDDGFVFSSVEIIDVSDYEQALGNAIIADDVFNGDAVLSPSEIFGDLLDDGLLFDKPTISPIKLMARSRTIGKDWRSRYAPKVDEQAGPQLRLPGPVSECRHGCVRSKCPACLKTPTKPTPKRPQRQPQVVDVFEQLFYILQPPILPAQGQPLIFPNGHKPYPFQIGGVKWLVEHESALLADEMGLGKTIQAIIALRILFRSGELQRTLVVHPPHGRPLVPQLHRPAHAGTPEISAARHSTRAGLQRLRHRGSAPIRSPRRAGGGFRGAKGIVYCGLYRRHGRRTATLPCTYAAAPSPLRGGDICQQRRRPRPGQPSPHPLPSMRRVGIRPTAGTVLATNRRSAPGPAPRTSHPPRTRRSCQEAEHVHHPRPRRPPSIY